MGSPSRNVQYHPPRLSEDRLNLPQPHSPSLPTHCTAPGNRECAPFELKDGLDDHKQHAEQTTKPRSVDVLSFVSVHELRSDLLVYAIPTCRREQKGRDSSSNQGPEKRHLITAAYGVDHGEKCLDERAPHDKEENPTH